jgi:Flp pilus assembly protein TadD
MVRAAPWLLLAAVLACAALAYRPALAGPFVLDDWSSIEANMRLRDPGAVRVPSPEEMLGTGRPITGITFALDWRAARLDPLRYHLVGLVLHLAAVVAAFAFLSSLLRRAGHPRARGVALVVASLFALHPIQAESVAYAAQRSEVLSSLLYLMALLLLDRAAAGWPGWRAALSWAGGGVAWLVGMGAKTIAISAPGAFLLDQAVVAPAAERGAGPLRRRVSRALLLAAPLLALSAWSAFLHLRSFDANPSGGAGFEATAVGAGDYFLTQLRVQWLYLRLLAWPDALTFDRAFTPSNGLDGAVLAAAAGVAALLAIAGWLWVGAERASAPRPAERLAAFGILFWFVALAPTSSFIPVADLAVEHRVYLACLGPFLAAVVGVDSLLQRLLPRPRAAASGAVLALVALLSLGIALDARARVWGSEVALWAAAAAASPGNARAWTNLGLARSRRDDRAGAEAAYVRGWSVVESPGRAASLARNHAALLIQAGRPAEALAVLDRGMALAPGDYSLHANRAAALGSMGRPVEALEEARWAARAAPGDPLMRNLLGQALSVNGDWPGALAEFQAAEGLDPGNPLYPVAAGVALSSLGRRDEACAAFRRGGARSGSRPLPLDAARRASALGCPILAP